MRPLSLLFCWLLAAPASGQAPDHFAHDDTGYVIAGQTEGAPTACSASAIAQTTSQLFAAINAGASDISARFFGRRPAAPFEWFSFSDRETGLGYETIGAPDGLDEHFAQRHASGNRWVLRGMEFTGWVPERHGVGYLIFFEYYLPDASGEKRRHLAFGKGEFHCPTFKFVVMSLGLRDQQSWDRLFRTHVISKRFTDLTTPLPNVSAATDAQTIR